MKKEYAFYHKDEFIMIGTIEEIAKHQNVSIDTINFYKTPTYKKRVKNGFVLVEV